MSFLEVRFPESIAFNSSSIIEFNTSIVTAKNGSEQRNINWSNNRMKYNIINGIKTKNELDEIMTFFRNVRGQGYGFRFKDWSDYSVKNQIIGIGNGEKKSFQLIKTYSVNNNTYIRKIKKPVISTIFVYLNGNQVNDFSLDLTTGILTFDTAPDSDLVITTDFEFDVPVRFNNDLLEITMNTINSGNIKDLILTEVI